MRSLIPSWFRRKTAAAPPHVSPELLQRIRGLEIRTRGLVESLFSGEFASVFHGRGLEFSHVRAYEFGDDVRAIDWKVTARRGTPYVRQFVEERDLLVTLVVDISASGRFGPGERSALEVSAEIAAALAFAAARNNDRIAMFLVGDSVERYVPPAAGRKQAMRILAELLTHRTRSRKTNLAAGLDELSRRLPPRASVFLISDFIVDRDDPELRRTLGKAGRKHDLVAIRLGTGGTAELPDVGWVELTDPESGRRVVMNSGSRRVQRRFRESVNRSQAAVAQLLSESGADLLEIPVNADPLAVLAAFFRRRQRIAR